MRVLGIIPARGGSKGIPRKNIKSMCGRPLIAYTIDAALDSARLTRTILSTEDQEIAEVGRSLGVEVPFLRPLALAGDATPTLPVVLHVLKKLEAAGEHYDVVCLLQPTSPLRRSQDIDACIEMLQTTGAESIVSVSRVPDEYNPQWIYWRCWDDRLTLSSGDAEPVPRRQDLRPAYHREGSVYLTRIDIVTSGSLYGKHMLGYEIPPAYSSNIDTPDDWQKVEARIVSGFANQSACAVSERRVRGCVTNGVSG